MVGASRPLSAPFLLVVAAGVSGFQIQKPSVRVPTQARSSAVPLERIALEREAQREVGPYQDWAAQCGVQFENGFHLTVNDVDGNEDFSAATSTGAAQGSRVLSVPGGLILSAYQMQQQYESYIGPSLQVLEDMGMQSLTEQFYLFLKVLLEYEQGSESYYYPWMAAMPRKWNTAVSMDEFCLACLPPFIKKLCLKEREQLDAFRAALQPFEYLTPESKSNDELLRFAYNVVFTRSFPTEYGLQIVPMADMLNQGYPENCALTYDENGNCDVVLTRDAAPGDALTLSYGEPTNPSRFLATYGFLNEAPATYCKLLLANPSQELINIGYDPSKMLFYTEDGSIAPEVWDVLLYHRLERKPDQAEYKNAFYQACMTGDEDTKSSIHSMFRKETAKALLLHVDYILGEVNELTYKMYSFDASKHPRLPLLRKHHEMVISTFTKVRANVAQMVENAA